MKTIPFNDIMKPIISEFTDNIIYIDHTSTSEQSEYIYTFQNNSVFILYVDDFHVYNMINNTIGSTVLFVKSYFEHLAKANLSTPKNLLVDIYIGKIGNILYLRLVPKQKGIAIRMKCETLTKYKVTPTLVTSQIDTSSFVKIN